MTVVTQVCGRPVTRDAGGASMRGLLRMYAKAGCGLLPCEPACLHNSVRYVRGVDMHGWHPCMQHWGKPAHRACLPTCLPTCLDIAHSLPACLPA
eukprot:177555-Chlamydomonas_euryale.AAC.5